MLIPQGFWTRLMTRPNHLENRLLTVFTAIAQPSQQNTILEMANNHRPKWIIFLAGFHYVIGILALLLGLFDLLYGQALLTVESSSVNVVGPITAFVGFGALLGELAAMFLGPLITIFGVIILITGVLNLFAGYGISALKSWGWILAVTLTVFNIINNGMIILLKEGATPWEIVGIGVSIFIFYCLSRPSTKRAFDTL